MIRRSTSLAALAALVAAAVVASGAVHGENDGAPRFAQQLVLPVAGDQTGSGHCVTVDPSTGEVFVCDPRRNRVLIFDAQGFFDFQIPGGEDFSGPEDVAIDPSGRLVLLAAHDGRRLPIELDFDGAFIRAVPLEGLPQDAAPPQLISIALSPSGDRLYALDDANRRVWIADRDGVLVGAADLVLDVPPDDVDDLSFGHVDVYGEVVLVAVPSVGRVMLFELDGTPRGGVGLEGGARCQLGYPTAAALDGQGLVWIVDQQRMVVTRWRVAGNRCVGEHLSIGDAPGYLYYPYDLSLDAARERVYTAQSYKGRVQVYEAPGAAPTPDVRKTEPDPR